MHEVIVTHVYINPETNAIESRVFRFEIEERYASTVDRVIDSLSEMCVDGGQLLG